MDEHAGWFADSWFLPARSTGVAGTASLPSGCTNFGRIGRENASVCSEDESTSAIVVKSKILPQDTIHT